MVYIAEDIGEEKILFRRNKKIIRSSLHVFDIDEYKKTANLAEVELLELFENLSDWIEKIYSIHL